jgi:hypothetical protein
MHLHYGLQVRTNCVVNVYIENAVQWQLLVLQWLEKTGVRYDTSSITPMISTAFATFQ